MAPITYPDAETIKKVNAKLKAICNPYTNPTTPEYVEIYMTF